MHIIKITEKRGQNKFEGDRGEYLGGFVGRKGKGEIL